MKSITSIALSICLLTIGTYYLRSNNISPTNTLVKTARILAESSFGNYKVEPSEGKKKNCQDYQESEIAIDEETRRKKFEERGGLLDLFSEEIGIFAKSNGEDTQKIEDEAPMKLAIYLFIPAIFLIIATTCCGLQIAFFILRLIFKILCCICCAIFKSDEKKKKEERYKERKRSSDKNTKKKLEEKRKDQEKDLNKKGQTFRNIICISSIALSALTLIGFIFWGLFSLGAIHKASLVQCSSSTFFSDMVNGIDSNTHKFPGLKGVISVLDGLAKDIRAANDQVKTPLQNIINRDLETKGQSFNNTFTTYKSNHKDSKMDACNSKDANQQFKPGATLLIDQRSLPAVVNTVFLSQYSIALHKGAVAFKQALDQTNIEDYVKPIEELKNKVQDPLLKAMQDGDKAANEDYSYDNYKPTILIIFYILLLGVISVVIFFLIMMFLTLRLRRCVALGNFFNIFISISIQLFGSIFLFLGILFFFSSTLVSSFCSWGNKVLEDKNYAKEVFPSDYYTYYEPCLAEGGSGKLSEVLGTNDLSGFTNVENLINSLVTPQDRLNLQNVTAYEQQLATHVDFTFGDDWEQSDGKGPLTQISKANDLIKCTGNEWALVSGGCSAGAQGTLVGSGTIETQDNANQACVLTPQLSYNTMSIRYSSGCASGSANEIHGIYNTNLKSCLGSYNTLTTNMKNEFTNNVVTSGNALKTDVDASSSDVDQIKQSFQNTINFVSGLNDGLSSAINCTVFRREAMIAQNAICFEFNNRLSYAAIVMLIVGPILVLLGLCVFCAVVQSSSKKKLKYLKGLDDAKPKDEESGSSSYERQSSSD